MGNYREFYFKLQKNRKVITITCRTLERLHIIAPQRKVASQHSEGVLSQGIVPLPNQSTHSGSLFRRIGLVVRFHRRCPFCLLLTFQKFLPSSLDRFRQTIALRTGVSPVHQSTLRGLN